MTNGFSLKTGSGLKKYSSYLYDESGKVLYFALSYKNDKPMASAKTEVFTQAEQDLAGFAKVLSHPARIAILKILAAQNACICGEIVEVLPLAQSTVSQHLKELKNAGLIKGTIEGPKSCYCINHEVFETLHQEFSSLFHTLRAEGQANCC